MAAWDVATGNLTSFDPSFDGDIYTIYFGGNNLFAGGDFTTVGGGQYPANFLTELDGSTLPPPSTPTPTPTATVTATPTATATSTATPTYTATP
jgi:hypothetical protein